MDRDEETFSSDESGFTEQDIRDHVDILFRTSDVEETGLVPVSSIIEYLRIHTSFGENEEDLSILVRLADPGGNNPRLTLEQYRQIMWQWIKQLQVGSRDSSDGGSEYEDFLSDSSNRVSSQSSSVKDPAGSSDLGSYPRQEEKYGVHQMGAPPEEVQQYLDKIHELQFQNSKLTEENDTLQQQIYNQEENVTQSNTTNDSLVRKVKYLQEAIQLKQQQDNENEELILRLQDQKQELHHKIESLTGDLDHLKTSNKELKGNIVEYEHKIEQMTEVKRAQEIQLSERFEELKNQQNQLLYLSNTVQELKVENTDLQSKLNQSNEAFISLKQSTEYREKEEHFTRFPCSTPIKKNSSICMELKGMLESGDHMPSPLCEKEIDEMDQIFPVFSSDGEDMEGSDPNISIYSVSLKDDLTMDVSKFMEKYQNKQDTLLEEIREFLGAGGASGDGSFTSEFVRKVEDQMSKLSQRVTTLAQAKTDVDKRLCSQKKKVKKLKEENAVLKDAADDVMENRISWDSVTDKRLLILKDQIDQERAHIKFMERKLRGKERTAVIVDKNKKSGAEKVLKLEIYKLQSLNKDLTEKNKKLQGKVNGLIDEVEKAHRDIENQQTKVKDLEAEKAVLELERQRAENQLTQKIKESKVSTTDNIVNIGVRGVLPFDLVATQTQAVREEPPSKLPSLKNNICTDEKNVKSVQQSMEHLQLDVGRVNEREEYIDDGGCQVEGHLYDLYNGGGQRRHSYQAAIDNHNCPPGEQHYPRCRSGSFQAAIEGGQKEEREVEVPESLVQILPTSMAKESGDGFHSYISSYNYLEDCSTSMKMSKSHGTSAYSQSPSPLCYSVCDSVQSTGAVGCGGDFTVNSSYLTCTDTSHNHCDVMIKQLCGSGGDVTDRQTGNKGKELCDMDPDFTDGQIGDKSRQFGTQWRDNAEDSAGTLEDTSLKHRLDDLNDTPEEPDVIQVTKSGKNNTVDIKALAAPSTISINPSISTATTLNSSDDETCIEHIKTASPPTTVADVNSQKESTAVMSKVKDGEKEALESKVKKKEELNEVKVEKSKGQDKEKERADTEEGDKDDDSITVTSNLIRQLEKLNLSDSSGSSDISAGGFKSSPYLKKIRQGNLAKRREQMKFLRMPDLNEMQESGQMMTNGDGESDSLVMPSIPETLLQDLGVDQDKTEQEESPDQLSEQEIENKFTSLSLAFKTDKITLEKRLEIQERSRDIAEENVAKEIKGLREALEQLNQICVDSQVRDLLLKIQKHVTVLEQASARVSSRAEVFGAVQQEKRMSKAIEIMLTHVDNLRLSHERQTAELEEARKLIQDNRPFGGSSDIGDFTGLSRRSASVCQSNAFLPKGARRRVSDATLNRSGLPHSVSMDCISESMHVTPSLRRELSITDEDARSKFQQLASVAALKNSTTSAFKRASMSKQTSTTSLLGQNLRLSQDSTQSESKSSGSGSKQHSVEEEAFQKGFEQGYKAQITGQLKQLRDQQNSITDSLEELRDKCEEAEEEETEEVSLRDTIMTKFWEHVPEWETASKKLRLATVIFFLFLAAVSVIMSFFPVGYAAVQVYPEYHHVNPPPV
ncbi:uncharacterized protein LOC133203387 [Saccostrea echinata]|uniref:uncharacterized protein LOC133203387 n=1 Tax=Saccostrea echinata TaxID=191078 RepID=UPI002A7EC0BC|nr:uncharacterized protein LOC133203387 [Saccostrea echinata]